MTNPAAIRKRCRVLMPNRDDDDEPENRLFGERNRNRLETAQLLCSACRSPSTSNREMVSAQPRDTCQSAPRVESSSDPISLSTDHVLDRPMSEQRGSFHAIVDDAEQVLDRAVRSTEPVELVVTPERLHRRNLKRRLAEQGSPRSSYRLTDSQRIAERLLRTADRQPETIDRIDRLKHAEALLGEETDANDRLRAVFGSDLRAHAETIEAAHRRVTSITAWAPARIEALETTAAGLPDVAAADTGDIVTGVRSLEQELAKCVDGTHSRGALLSDAASLVAEDPTVWRESFPTIERLSLAGVSAVDAPLLDLLAAATSAGVDVRLYLRPGTGPAIAERLADRVPDCDALSGVAGGEFSPPSVPTSELVADTPEAEARLAAGVVAGLLRKGVSPSDVLVVARDAESYERAIERAAGRHGVSLAVWAQLPVERTLPYRLFDACCTLLGTAEPSLSTLLAPLEFQWVPPASESEVWPLTTEQVAAVRSELAENSALEQPVSAWLAKLDDDSFAPLRTYLEWVTAQPETPEPVALHGTFEPVFDAYRELVLPTVFAADDPDLGRTAQHARAIVRIEELLVDTRAKYDEWLDAGDLPRSWLAVAELAERVVATRPGRREHANAAAVDVVDATDAWLRQVPHVVAVGLVDGVWPRRPESVFPSAFRRAVVKGDSAAARRLAVPGRWTASRETDHLASAVDAATEQLICSRYRRDREGTEQERSQLLSTLSPQPLPASTAESLRAGTLPDSLAPANGGGSQ